MGLDCSRPSRSFNELYLPADTFRLCNPRDSRCWCDRGHHRDPRYLYVERGGDGRERFHDPFDYMDRFMMGGSWQLPWKDVQHWTTRDYDRLGEIMTEYNNRLRGRQMQGWSGGVMRDWMSMVSGMMMVDEMRAGSRSPRRYGRRGGMPRYDYNDMRRAMVNDVAELYQDRLRNIEDVLWGSEGEKRETGYKAQQMKIWQDILQMINANQMGMNGMNGMNNLGAQNGMYPNMGMPMGGVMPQQYPGMGGMTPQQQYAAAMANAQNGTALNGMPGQYNPLGGMGDPRLGGGLGGGLGRRSGLGRNRRRGLAMADDLDNEDDIDDILRSRSRRRRPGRRRWGDDDLDDELGGLDDSTSPRRPRPPPRGPKGPIDLSGPSVGGAGLTFDNGEPTHVRAGRTRRRGSSPEIVVNTTGVDAGNSPIRETTTGIGSPPPGTIPRRAAAAGGPAAMPTAADRQAQEMFMPSVGMMHGHGYGMMPSRGMMPGYPAFDRIGAVGGSGSASRMPSPAGASRTMSGALQSGQFGMPGMGGTTRPGRMGSGVRFSEGIGLSRPRQDEENRGEPEAGGTADRRRDAETS